MQGNPVYHWYYGAIELEDNVSTIHQHPEGRISVDTIQPDTTFEYSIKDHLGNTVVTFSDKDEDGTLSSPEVLQRNMYYLFGNEIKSTWTHQTLPIKNNYLYNGKEFHDWVNVDINACE